jgi:hypothetical protein
MRSSRNESVRSGGAQSTPPEAHGPHDPSTVTAAMGALVAVVTWTAHASAQSQCPAPSSGAAAAEGFALDRLYLSAPGAGWFVMDSLDVHGGLAGAVSLTTEYAHDPLRVRSSDSSQDLAVVSDEVLANFGFMASYDRFRVYLDLAMPLDVTGQGGIVGNSQFTAPTTCLPYTPSGVNPSTAPDTLSDGRVGVDARLLGAPGASFRLGASAQLFIPSPNTVRSEYLTDGTFRAMGRVLFAGDVGALSYAGQLGVHIRPLDDGSTPGSPQGSELLFGAAAGARVATAAARTMSLVVGPEVFGATAFRSFFGSDTTAVEGLLTGRVEGTGETGPQLRVKLGIGGGIDAHFGAPEWRAVVAVEVFGRPRPAE